MVDSVQGELKISGLKLRARVGHTEEERRYPQLVQLDVLLTLDFSDCLKSEELEKTVDYLAVVSVLEELVKEYSWKLVEKMAFDAAETLISKFARVDSASLVVTKFVRGDAAGFSTSVKRNRR